MARAGVEDWQGRRPGQVLFSLLSIDIERKCENMNLQKTST